METLQFLNTIVKPMLAATEASVLLPIPKRKGKSLVTLPSGQLLIRDELEARNAWMLKRDQPFSANERYLVLCLIESFQDIQRSADALVPQLMDFIVRKAISKSLANDEQQRATLQSVLENFEDWSTQTYEGARISAGVEVTNAAPVSGRASFFDIAKEDFSRALTDGLDSWWILSKTGTIAGFHASQYRDAPPVPSDGFFPIRYEPIALSAQNGTITSTLNRNGEILVFARGELRFAKRRGGWVHFAHEAIIRQMSPGGKNGRPLRTAIYQSCLDASFSRTGACIGLLRHNRINEFRTQNVVKPEDVLDPATNPSLKARTSVALIGGRAFTELERATRKELLALDGATVVVPNGTLLAAGAILNLGPVGHGNQGGRSAAAKTLGLYGLGIKVSQDGKISAFKPDHVDDPWFQVG